MNAPNEAFGIVTASVNWRYGDGDDDLFEQAVREADASGSAAAIIRELANLAGTFIGVLAHDSGFDPLELWSSCATNLLNTDAQPCMPTVSKLSRLLYQLSECDRLAEHIDTEDIRHPAERDVVLSQATDTIKALRRLRRRI